MEIEYFGTDTRQPGHYRWKIIDNRMQRTWAKFDDLPIHPEQMVNQLPNGQVNWIVTKSAHGTFTICAIAGSPADSRPGCKSVFWVKGVEDFKRLKIEILASPIFSEIINKMPFDVAW